MSWDIKLHRKLKGYNPICGKVKGVQHYIYVLSIKASINNEYRSMIMAIRGQDNVGADYLSR